MAEGLNLQFTDGKEYNLDSLDRGNSESPLVMKVNEAGDGLEVNEDFEVQDGQLAIPMEQKKITIKRSDIRKYI